MKKHIILILSLLLLLCWASIVQASTWNTPVNLSKGVNAEADPCISGDGSKVVFARNDGEDWEIFVINSDGTGLMQLTDNSEDDRDPSINFDGTEVAFRSGSLGSREIFVIKSNGQGLKQVTNNAEDDVELSLSGDGNKIAFTRMEGELPELYVINSDGTGEKKLTDSNEAVLDPSLSNDGNKIAFRIGVGSRSNVFVINSDGSGLKQLTHSSGNSQEHCTFPYISGDGRKVVFAYNANLDENTSEIFVINVDSSGLTQLTNNAKGDRYPSINSDGTKVAFQQGFDDQCEIYVVNSDGSALTQLTNNNQEDRYTSISDNGQQIAFENKDGEAIFVVSLSSSPAPTPSVPEFSWLAILPMLIGMFSVAVILRQRKTTLLSK